MYILLLHTQYNYTRGDRSMLQSIFSNLNLTKKLTFSFLLLAFIPVAIVTAISMNTMYDERLEQIDQHNIYLARLKAGDMAETFMSQAQ